MRFPAFNYTQNSSRHKSMRIHLFSLIGIFLACFFTLSSVAEEFPAPHAKKDVTSFRIKIRKLQEGILEQEDQKDITDKQERSILAELEILDKKLVEQLQKLNELKRKINQQQERIDRETEALKTIRHEKQLVEAHLKKRITAYYTMGDIGLLNVSFSSKSFPELLTFHDAFNTLIKYDQDVIQVYQDTLAEQTKVKKGLALEKSVLESFLSQTVHETRILEQTKDEKRRLLVHVRTQSQLHQQAITEMQAASDRLANAIVDIKNQNQIFENGFEVNRGSLPPPVDGTLVTLFDQEKRNKLGIVKKSKGIELTAPDDTDIVAVSDGQVIFAGYLRGYGNTVVLHHGFQYYTVTSRIESILVEKGQEVRRETPIGRMGATATLFDGGLYFEIRHGQQSLDPLLWLNPNRLHTVHEEQPHSAEPETSVDGLAIP